MAIKYKDLKKKLETDPLSESELVLISQAEEDIDSEIIKYTSKTATSFSFSCKISSGKEVLIDSTEKPCDSSRFLA